MTPVCPYICGEYPYSSPAVHHSYRPKIPLPFHQLRFCLFPLHPVHLQHWSSVPLPPRCSLLQLLQSHLDRSPAFTHYQPAPPAYSLSVPLHAQLLSLSVPVEQMLANHFQESILPAPSNGSQLFQTYPSLASTEVFAGQIHVVEHHSGNSIP